MILCNLCIISMGPWYDETLCVFYCYFCGSAACAMEPISLICDLGSYYLTTTYGALEHIKNYDKLEVTGQLSLEIQDSIHRWERRRTLNKARGSHTSVQVSATMCAL